MKRHEKYRGHDIVVEGPAVEVMDELAAARVEPELEIDDEPILTIRDKSGMYIAANFAYAPQDSLLNLAKRIIDYRQRIEEGDHGSPEEPG